MCYNVTAPLDLISFEKEVEIAEQVREVVTVGRVIVFGGTGNTMQDLYAARKLKTASSSASLRQNLNLMNKAINAAI